MIGNQRTSPVVGTSIVIPARNTSVQEKIHDVEAAATTFSTLVPDARLSGAPGIQLHVKLPKNVAGTQKWFPGKGASFNTLVIVDTKQLAVTSLRLGYRTVLMVSSEPVWSKVHPKNKNSSRKSHLASAKDVQIWQRSEEHTSELQ